MKLEEAIDIGAVCGLMTVEESVRNIDHHAMQLFKYDDIAKQLTELYDEYNDYLHDKLELDIEAIQKKSLDKLNCIMEGTT